ncbi:MAG: tRNA-specific 2-thiouridylase [Rikenellaceae bacterium]
MKEIVLGFSGGMDSYAAVERLRSQGFTVKGVTLDLIGDNKLILKARSRAAELGIELDILDMRARFRDVIEANFISEYLAGRTPAPCTLCNSAIKWHSLREYANANNIHHIATGHYFRVAEHDSRLYVAKALDPRKDQSYYLWGLNSELLSRVVTPMADVIKSDIIGSSPIKGESMGVCFLRGVGYSQYICHRCGEQPSGDILNSQGRVVGRHSGVVNYTIGQRRGEGIPAGLSVAKIDAKENTITVDTRDSLYRSELVVEGCNIVCEQELLSSSDISVVVRGIGLNPQGYASITKLPTVNSYHIRLDSPAWAVASGQPVVLYRGDRVIGGGVLK